MEQVLNSLPDGWILLELGEICDFQGGSQPPKSEFIYEPKEGYTRFIQIRDFSSDKNLTYIPVDSTNRFCNEDDVLIGRYGASVGKILTGLEGAYNVALIKTIPNESIIYKPFFRRILESSIFQYPLLSKKSSRAAQAGFNKNDIGGILFPIPPLNEQKRIIEKLDAVLTRIDTAIEHLQENLDASKSLLASALFERFHQEVNPTPIKDIFNVYNGRAYKKPELLDSGKYKVIRIQNLKGGENYYYSDLELDENKYCESGDLLFSWSGTPGTSFGAFIWNDEKAIYHYHIWKMEPKLEIAPRYAYWVLKDITEEAIANARGVAGMLHITKGTMESFIVSLPSYESQQKIAKELDELALKSEQLQTEISSKIDSLKHLKASILDSAFKGEL